MRPNPVLYHLGKFRSVCPTQRAARYIVYDAIV